MTCDPEKHRRRSIRLEGYDYSQPGAYFVTICAEDHLCLFATVRDGKSMLNPAGRMVRRWWHKVPEKFDSVRSDAFIIMPNHVHGILIITDPPSLVGADPRVRPDDGMSAHDGTHPYEGAHMGAPLPTVVQWFKTMTTNAYIRGVKQRGWRPFPGRLWQRNYWERVIRNRRELQNVRRYIVENPSRWEYDRNHPTR